MAARQKPNAPPPNWLTLEFGDGEYEMRFGVLQVAELQEKCSGGDGQRIGIGAIYARLMAGRYRDKNGGIVLNPTDVRFAFEDIYETIRLALIGGGRGEVNGQTVEVGPIQAKKLCDRYVLGRPLLESWKIAAAVLSAYVVGYEPPKATAQKKTRARKPKSEPVTST